MHSLCACSSEDRVFDSDSKDRGFESRQARHVAADDISFAAIYFVNPLSLILSRLPFRQRARSQRLLGCKRARDGSASLATFCGCLQAAAPISSIHPISSGRAALRNPTILWYGGIFTLRGPSSSIKPLSRFYGLGMTKKARRLRCPLLLLLKTTEAVLRGKRRFCGT